MLHGSLKTERRGKASPTRPLYLISVKCQFVNIILNLTNIKKFNPIFLWRCFDVPNKMYKAHSALLGYSAVQAPRSNVTPIALHF